MHSSDAIGGDVLETEVVERPPALVAVSGDGRRDELALEEGWAWQGDDNPEISTDTVEVDCSDVALAGAPSRDVEDAESEELSVDTMEKDAADTETTAELIAPPGERVAIEAGIDILGTSVEEPRGSVNDKFDMPVGVATVTENPVKNVLPPLSDIVVVCVLFKRPLAAAEVEEFAPNWLPDCCGPSTLPIDVVLAPVKPDDRGAAVTDVAGGFTVSVPDSEGSGSVPLPGGVPKTLGSTMLLLAVTPGTELLAAEAFPSGKLDMVDNSTVTVLERVMLESEEGITAVEVLDDSPGGTTDENTEVTTMLLFGNRVPVAGGEGKIVITVKEPDGSTADARVVLVSPPGDAGGTRGVAGRVVVTLPGDGKLGTTEDRLLVMLGGTRGVTGEPPCEEEDVKVESEAGGKTVAMVKGFGEAGVKVLVSRIVALLGGTMMVVFWDGNGIAVIVTTDVIVGTAVG